VLLYQTVQILFQIASVPPATSNGKSCGWKGISIESKGL